MAIEISASLIKKLNKPGPRYTSYPTVPYWKNISGDTPYREKLSDCLATGKPLSLYFHIPFCPRICAYCGCNSVRIGGKDALAQYVQALSKEMELVTRILGKRHRVIQIHWGGGTPSILSESLMKRLFHEICENFTVLENAEIAIEVNPMSTSLNKIRVLRQLGFNRISLGIQDLDPVVQKAIFRNQSEEKTRRIFTECREQGFSSINVDLIYGLPSQHLDSFSKTLESIIELAPDRVAVYSFAYLPSVKKHQERIDKSLLPDAETKIQLYLQTIKQFTGNGYEFIGMDHFAKPEDELAIALREKRLHRNFMGYTCQPEPDVIAMGITAISDLKTYYVQNVKEIDTYYDLLGKNQLPIQKQCSLQSDDIIRRYLITRLMCDFQVSKQYMEDIFHIRFQDYFEDDLPRMRPLEDLNLVINSEREIKVTELGRYFVRNICFCFDPYYNKTLEQRNRVPFSKTV